MSTHLPQSRPSVAAYKRALRSKLGLRGVRLQHGALNSDPAWCWDEVEYRVKPSVIKYRRYLWKTVDNQTQVGIFQNALSIKMVEEHPSFIRWIDTEWQETEV